MVAIDMKRFVVIGIGAIAIVAGIAGYRACCQRQRKSVKNGAELVRRDDAPQWTPSGAELANGNQGVGWVFGRVMGVAEAPGNPNYSPFGGPAHWRPSDRVRAYPRQ